MSYSDFMAILFIVLFVLTLAAFNGVLWLAWKLEHFLKDRKSARAMKINS